MVEPSVQKDLSSNRSLYTYERDNFIRVGDNVIFYESIDQHKQDIIKKGGTYTTTKGMIRHDELIDSDRYGTKVYTTNKRHFIYVLRPSSDLHTRCLAQRTQILYTPDISQVCFRLQLKPGFIVCESGTGSGSLSTSLAKMVLPTGKLFTFEFNESRVVQAQREFKEMGLQDYVTVTHRDVLSKGFLLEDKVEENMIDACFLDLPNPHIAIKHAYQVLKKKGRLCNFSPCIEQVQKVSTEMAKLGFYEIQTIECLNREYDAKKSGFKAIPDYETQAEQEEIKAPEKSQQKKRDKKAFDKELLAVEPNTTMRGHTGYLTFAIKF